MSQCLEYHGVSVASLEWLREHPESFGDFLLQNPEPFQPKPRRPWWRWLTPAPPEQTIVSKPYPWFEDEPLGWASYDFDFLAELFQQGNDAALFPDNFLLGSDDVLAVEGCNQCWSFRPAAVAEIDSFLKSRTGGEWLQIAPPMTDAVQESLASLLRLVETTTERGWALVGSIG